MSSTISRRSGGRTARRALRAAPLKDNDRPIRAGMEGGTYKPLSDFDVQKIHTAALDALETIGLADAPPSGVEILTNAGAIQGEDGRIRFPRSLVEDMLTKARREVTLFSMKWISTRSMPALQVQQNTLGHLSLNHLSYPVPLKCSTKLLVEKQNTVNAHLYRIQTALLCHR